MPFFFCFVLFCLVHCNEVTAFKFQLSGQEISAANLDDLMPQCTWNHPEFKNGIKLQ